MHGRLWRIRMQKALADALLFLPLEGRGAEGSIADAVPTSAHPVAVVALLFVPTLAVRTRGAVGGPLGRYRLGHSSASLDRAQRDGGTQWAEDANLFAVGRGQVGPPGFDDVTGVELDDAEVEKAMEKEWLRKLEAFWCC